MSSAVEQQVENLEIVISRDPGLTWAQFEAAGKGAARAVVQDREDPSIYYEDGKAKGAGMQLRTLTCLIHNCGSTQHTKKDCTRPMKESTPKAKDALVDPKANPKTSPSPKASAAPPGSGGG